MGDNKVKLIIDGREVEASKDSTILKAALSVGIDIPYFCWHPNLEPVGACRMCLVEVEKMPKLVASCVNPVTEGMVVHTNSEKVIEARKKVLEFILTNHPLDCPTCDKGGECHLQDLTYNHGPMMTRYREDKVRWIVDTHYHYDDLKLGPLVYRNQNRCISCFRCVRITREIFGYSDLGAFGRGAKTHISAPGGLKFLNEFSGNAVEYCPVGALTARNFRYKIRPWLCEQTPTVCPLCGDGCNMTAWSHQRSGHIRNTSRRNDFIDEGMLCDRGRFGSVFSNHPDRIKSPMIKEGDSFREVGWEEALDFIADRIKKLKAESGAEALGGIASDLVSNEEAYLFGRLMRQGIGTNNLDFRADRKSLLGTGGLKILFEMQKMSVPLEKVADFDTVFVIGTDIASTHPIYTMWLKKGISKAGLRVLAANSRKLDFGIYSAQNFTYKPGGELALLLGLLKVIVKEKLYSETPFHGGEFSRWANSLQKTNYDTITASCGLSEEKIGVLARAVAESKNCLLVVGQDLWEGPLGTSCLLAINDLAVLTENNGNPKGGVSLLFDSGNYLGALDWGLAPDYLPARRHREDKLGQEKIESLWNCRLPDREGLDTIGMLAEIQRGNFKGLYLCQSDLLSDFPDWEYIHDCLSKLELLVVCDLFLTETAKMATVVLPAASFVETEGTFTNTEGRIQHFQRGTVPPKGVRETWRTLSRLAHKLGAEFAYKSPGEIFREMVTLSSQAAGLDYDKLGADGRIVALAEKAFEPALYEVEFDGLSSGESDYPYTLLAGDLVYHLRHLTNYNEDMMLVAPEAHLEVSPEDAGKLDLKEGDTVRVESVKGALEVGVVISKKSPPGIVFLPRNYSDQNVNKLKDREKVLDYVRITKVS
jgi:NADH-quinone oxidoreductase chain G